MYVLKLMFSVQASNKILFAPVTDLNTKPRASFVFHHNSYSNSYSGNTLHTLCDDLAFLIQVNNNIIFVSSYTRILKLSLYYLYMICYSHVL